MGPLANICTWYATKFGELLDRLAAVREGNGTMLDNTLVVWGSELGKGNSHSFAQVPFVLAGGAGGAIRPGRFLQYPAGVTHNRLLVAICHAMGATSINTVGNTDTGTGPLAGLLACRAPVPDRTLCLAVCLPSSIPGRRFRYPRLRSPSHSAIPILISSVC